MRRLVSLVPALVLFACGSPEGPADAPLRVAEPAGEVAVRYPRAGMRFRVPTNWERRSLPASGVFSIESGDARVSGFAYERRELLPRSAQELGEARRALVERVRARDPSFELERSRTLRIARAPAIEIRGTQTIARRKLRTRSVHVFRGRVEYVVEALVPPADFERVDRGVLELLLRSLRVTGRLEAAVDPR